MEFEWDTEKALLNYKKHGISFQDATKIFLDPLHRNEAEESAFYDENRYIAIGKSDGRILVVVYTFRDETIRIISARKANAYERRHYHKI